MSAPKRIQRKRTRGWKMPEGAVYVGRPTMFGNPFKIGALTYVYRGNGGWEQVEIEGRRHATDLFREWITGDLRTFERERHHLTHLIGDLAGKDLACWCPFDQPCHADVLLELANGDESPIDPSVGPLGGVSL